MSSDRRFNEQEVSFILERAAAAEPTGADDSVAVSGSADRASSAGMTLTQLQEIAAEVGLSASAVEAAANAIDRGDLVPTRRMTYAGLPVGVARTIQFNRAVTDAEWERMVVALRETFQARGRTQRDGSLRHWSNGNLQALLEPTANGHRLRLQTRKGDARLMVGLGVGSLVMSATTAFSLLMASTPAHPPYWSGPIILGALGIATIARAALSLPGWARERAQQMEQFAEVAERILRETDLAAALPAAK
jgi:hypothetical protein